MTISAIASAAPVKAGWREDAATHIARHQVMPRSAEVRGVSCHTRLAITVDGNGLVTRATEELMLTLPQFPPPPQRQGGTAVLPVDWPPAG
jgi:hypothetical protein